MKISSGYGVRGGGVFNAPNVPEAPVLVYVDASGTPTIPKADVDRYRAKGMPVKWYGPTAPTAAHGAVSGDVYRGTTLTIGGGGPTNLTVTYSGGAWDKTPAQVAAARATGGTIAWSTTSVAPTTANGLAVGDIVTSSAPLTTAASLNPNKPITIQNAWAPTKTDANGTGSDVVTLTRVLGVTWTVDGVAHDYASFSGATTKAVPYAKGVNTTVTATADAGYQFYPDSMTSSWTLTFTDVVPPAGMVTSSDFSNYSSGTTFTENAGSGVPITFNNAFGGTQTTGSAKYCNVSSGGLVLQNSGSFLAHASPAITSNVTQEWTHKGNSGTGDTFFFPMYKGATGNGWGARVTSGGLLGTGKVASWTVSNSGITYTSGSAPTLAANDQVKLVATSTTMTAFVNGVQVWSYNFASMVDNNSAQVQIGTTSGTSYTMDDYKFSAT